jgi:hypothetical protein
VKEGSKVTEAKKKHTQLQQLLVRLVDTYTHRQSEEREKRKSRAKEKRDKIK